MVKEGKLARAFAVAGRSLISLVEHGREGVRDEKRREEKRRVERTEYRADGRRRRYRGENSAARNESSAVGNPDRNQSDSICIMEKARDNVCTSLSARARFLFRLSFLISLSLSLSPLGRRIVRSRFLSPVFPLASSHFLFILDADSPRIGSGIEWNQRAC